MRRSCSSGLSTGLIDRESACYRSAQSRSERPGEGILGRLIMVSNRLRCRAAATPIMPEALRAPCAIAASGLVGAGASRLTKRSPHGQSDRVGFLTSSPMSRPQNITNTITGSRTECYGRFVAAAPHLLSLTRFDRGRCSWAVLSYREWAYQRSSSRPLVPRWEYQQSRRLSAQCRRLVNRSKPVYRSRTRPGLVLAT
jgi:hypothetical protein